MFDLIIVLNYAQLLRKFLILKINENIIKNAMKRKKL